jgi:hypothetical protein
MTLNARARGAVRDIRRAVESDASVPGGFGDPARFHRDRARKARNQRIVAALVAVVIAVASVVLVANTFRSERVPATPLHPDGLIVFQRSAPGLESGRLFIVNPDGTDEVALPWSVDVECPTWFPDGSKILIAGYDYPGAPLRPATINPDGSGSVVLDGVTDPNLNLGCGDVSPDGTRLVLEGFPTGNDPSVGGLYSVRASDGGDPVRLTRPGHGGEPSYLPDGRILSGYENPKRLGTAVLYVINADGTGKHRLNPGRSFAWGGEGRAEASPDGSWIVHPLTDGTLGLIRPDGTGFHNLPMNLPPGAAASWPQWSPDATRIVFELADGGETHVYTVRADGSDLTAIVDTPGVDERNPAWGPAV